MSSLDLMPVFKEVSSLIAGEAFSTMYFGKHCGKNVIILKHDPLTVMLVFGINDRSLTPEFAKTVSCRGNLMKRGIEIVGNEDVILLLDEDGNLWRLINAFQFSDQRDECLYLLEEKCFYEWVPFKTFHFEKVLALSAFDRGFACIGINKSSQKKLEIFSSVSMDCTFDELNSGHSSNYSLSTINIQGTPFRNDENFINEVLLVTDRVSGRSYICSKGGRASLINSSSIPLVSLLNFEEEKCLLMCFSNGKLVFDFYSDSSQSVIFLSKPLVFVKKCGCQSCILWSDGIDLHHSKVEFGNQVKLVELQVSPSIKGALAFIKVHSGGIAVSVNSFYYHVMKNDSSAEKDIEKEPHEFLSEIYQGGLKINELNKKIETMRDYLECKEIIQSNGVKRKVEIGSEGKFLTLKTNTGKVFKKDCWRVRLLRSIESKHIIRMENLEMDVCEGLVTHIETPFVEKGNATVGFVGNFDAEFDFLFVKLGEIGEEADSEGTEVRDKLREIAAKRNPYFGKEQAFL